MKILLLSFNGNTSSYEAEDMMSDNFHWGLNGNI